MHCPPLILIVNLVLTQFPPKLNILISQGLFPPSLNWGL